MNTLHIEHLAIHYGQRQVIKDLSLHLAAGEIGCLLGPSGCGKTTVLRAIAGFEPPSHGHIMLGKTRVADAMTQMAPEKRNIGMVFQDYALFPHLSVAKNIAFGLRSWKKQERTQRVDELLQLVGLTEHAHHLPHQLSGGQQQRVALARALAPKPKILLLDEPFSNLDIALRERLSLEVRDMMKHENTTVLIVTHDQQEAFAMADKVGVLMDGKLLQWASPYALYHEPHNHAIADFIGESTLLSGTIKNECCLITELGELCHGQTLAFPIDTNVDILIRPDDIQHDDHSPTKAKVIHKIFRGAEFLYTLALPSGQHVYSLIPSHHDHAIGEMIGIQLEIDHLIVYEKQSVNT